MEVLRLSKRDFCFYFQRCTWHYRHSRVAWSEVSLSFTNQTTCQIMLVWVTLLSHYFSKGNSFLLNGLMLCIGWILRALLRQSFQSYPCAREISWAQSSPQWHCQNHGILWGRIVANTAARATRRPLGTESSVGKEHIAEKSGANLNETSAEQLKAKKKK